MKALKLVIPQIRLIIFIVLLGLSIPGCQKDFSGNNGNPGSPPDTTPDFTARVSSSVSGFITDEYNAPVQGALVQIGNITITSDEYGYFNVRHVQVVKNIGVVTITKPGYFKNIKTYVAEEGKSAFFRAKLLPKVNIGNFMATTGGTLSTTSGLKLIFPANAVINAATGQPYSGSVKVTAVWMNPGSSNLDMIMPGDLRGIDSLGKLKLLQTYGMAAVEITSTGGELLQIAPGKKTTMEFPLPATFLSTAPSEIPLWYFNVSNGLWQQEGKAIKTGSNYIGEVGHFSFWNCDVPNNYVQFSCTIVDANNAPLQNAQVRLKVQNTNNQRSGYTDSSGYVSGLVPANSALTMTVYARYDCNTAAYAQNLNTSGTNISLGIININNSFYTFTVSGLVKNCNGFPVTNGSISIKHYNDYYSSSLSSNGSYSVNLLFCDTTGRSINLKAKDHNTNLESLQFWSSVYPGQNTVPSTTACSLSNLQFVNFTINGVNDILNFPPDSLLAYGQLNSIYSINASRINISNNMFLNFAFNTSNIAAGTTQLLTSIQGNIPVGYNSVIPTPINVNITECGALNEYISGNFYGNIIGSPPNNTPVNISCAFRVRKNF